MNRRSPAPRHPAQPRFPRGGVVVRELWVPRAWHPSRIPGVDAVITPYSGCAFGCLYCYAAFTRRFHRGPEPWGRYVDVRRNIADRLAREISTLPPAAHVFLSSVTDPYQGVEARYHLTRKILSLLLTRKDLRITLLTRSPLILRDLDLLRKFGERLRVYLSIPTDMEAVRRIFEPRAPSLSRRIHTLRTLHRAGIPTGALLAPLLPCHPERLARMVAPWVRHVRVDRLNYPWKVASLLRRHRAEFTTRETWFQACVHRMRTILGDRLEVRMSPPPSRGPGASPPPETPSPYNP